MVTATDRIPFWNDFFIKSQFIALSSSSPQQQNMALDKLPDEILINILSQPVMDLDTLGHVLGVSERMCQLSLHILNQYRLPSLQFAFTIDQEGKNRITSKFRFDHLDLESLSISFTCIGKRPRRYYSNKASPVVRSMTMTDYYSQQSQPSIMPSTDTCISFPDEEDDKFSFKSKECPHLTPAAQIKEAFLLSQQQIAGGTTIESDTSSKVHIIINRKIQQTKKEGLHILQVSHSPLVVLHNNKACWKFGYEISQLQKHEYHLLPLNITIRLDQLLLLDNHKKKQNKRWKIKMMDWVINHI